MTRPYRAAAHAANIGKYTLGAVAAATHALWAGHRAPPAALSHAFVAFSLLSSLAGYAWDIRMDWGLLRVGAGARLLRPTLLGPPRLYYAFMAANAVLRLAWLAQLSPSAAARPAATASGLAALEVLRRCGWSYLRVETEHAANVDARAAVAIVSLPSFERGRQPGLLRRWLSRAAAADAPPNESAAALAAKQQESWARRGKELAEIGMGVPPSPRRIELGEHFAWGGEDEDENP